MFGSDFMRENIKNTNILTFRIAAKIKSVSSHGSFYDRFINPIMLQLYIKIKKYMHVIIISIILTEPGINK